MNNTQNLFTWYLEHQDELAGKYCGKYAVITKDGVQDVCDNEDDGFHTGVKKFGLGNFIIQLCAKGKDAYSVNVYSQNYVMA